MKDLSEVNGTEADLVGKIYQMRWSGHEKKYALKNI